MAVGTEAVAVDITRAAVQVAVVAAVDLVRADQAFALAHEGPS